MAVIAAASRLTPLRGGRDSTRRREVKAIGDFSHFGETVRKDFNFLKKGLKKGIDWAMETLPVNGLARTLDDVLWLKGVEDPKAPPLENPSWPQPSYAGLTGVDLFMADVKALVVYATYFYLQSKIWTKPLPEVYDPQDVSDYFACRPHVVALRLIEVFIAFSSAAIRIRTSGIRKALPSSRKNGKNVNTSQYNFGVILKETILGLGPTFIKVGQSLSTRPDIIGNDISKALSELHDQIPPFPKTIAMKIIEEELGSPTEKTFTYISDEPVAAASFGQVYRGNTMDGHSVAVKVQRPNLRHVVVRDVYILRLGLGLLQKVAKRKSDLRLYADELGKGLVGELDYSLEAANASKFLETHSSFHFMRVPKIYRHLSRKRVLTMEWIDGESATDLLFASTGNTIGDDSTHPDRQIIEGRRRLLDLVNKGVESTLVQLLETGLLHADPHPGNLRYTASGQIGFLDFGLLCQMENKHRFAMLASIVQIVNGDWASLVKSLVQMDVIRPGTNIRLVTMELESSLGEVEFKDGIPDVKFSRVLGKIWSIALKYHFRMPPYYTLLLRSLASFEGLAVAADPNFKTFEAAYPYVVQKLLTQNSAETRKILYSVVLNKRKEFRWDRVALFLRVGSTREMSNRMLASKSGSSLEHKPNNSNDVVGISQLVVQLLASRDGVVLRKLLMTADETSLIQAVVSKEAFFFRQHLSRVIACILHQWMVQTLRIWPSMSQYGYQVKSGSGPGNIDVGQSSRLPASVDDYLSVLRDRRVRVIFRRIVVSARKQPLLMLKLCWTSFIVVLRALAMSVYQVFISLSEAYVGWLSVAPIRLGIAQ